MTLCLKPAAGLCAGRRVGIYGSGGIGKTSLAALAPGLTAFIDLDASLPDLALEGVQVVEGVQSWVQLRGALQAAGWEEVRNIVIDSLTRAEELALHYTLATVVSEKGYRVKRLEDYGYGKGYQHVYETFLGLLDDLDRHVAAGRNVILIMHDCVSSVPNPTGEDWIRFEPRLQAPNSGKASIRLRVKEWLSDLLFVCYDVTVDSDGKQKGKGRGHGARTIHPLETPFCMAKSRKLDQSFEYIKGDAKLWSLLLGGGDA
jgi:hypothetical protein